jgi:transposase-like protein
MGVRQRTVFIKPKLVCPYCETARYEENPNREGLVFTCTNCGKQFNTPHVRKGMELYKKTKKGEVK